jgi:Domain of unknown function (DUF4124)
MRIGPLLLCLAVCALPSLAGAQKQALYRWIDKEGNVHFSDKVPPDAAAFDRELFNAQGVSIGFQEGEITPEERAAKAAQAAEEEAARAARAEVTRHDRMLLETYITVHDIEDLRDRRLELLESQIKVTELYLTNLRKRLVGLQAEASSFKPYSTSADAPQIPDNLALDISRTLGSINTYEQTLARTRADQQTLRASFDSDIVRFKKLKGG